MSRASAKLSLAFSCIGHTYSHLFAPIFYVVALTLERDLQLTHGQVVGLIVIGNVLFGVAAPLAGWLGDRWSATGMIRIFFVGTGAAMVLVATAGTPAEITLWLSLTGAFAAIYHPVGIAWLVRNAENRGTALGINGVFGGIGPAVAAVLAGVLIEAVDWRAAFWVPGIAMLATGAVFHVLLRRRLIVEATEDRNPDPPTSMADRVRAFLVLAVTMLCTGLIYQATQPVLPKLFSERLDLLADDGVLGISGAVALVYLVAGGAQVVAGRLADRYPLKWVYLATFVLQVPFLAAAAGLEGSALLVAALVMVTVNVGSLPAENSLVARFAASGWRGLAFGLKFILAFGLSGLGVMLEGGIYDLTGGFHWLFMVLGAIAVVAAAACLMLPEERAGENAETAPATP